MRLSSSSSSYLTEDLNGDELTVVNALIASQHETIQQQRSVIALQKEKIVLLEKLVARHESQENRPPTSSSSTMSTTTTSVMDELVQGLRHEVSLLRSMNQRYLERLTEQDIRLREHEEALIASAVGSVEKTTGDDGDIATTAAEVERPPTKKARNEE